MRFWLPKTEVVVVVVEDADDEEGEFVVLDVDELTMFVLLVLVVVLVVVCVEIGLMAKYPPTPKIMIITTVATITRFLDIPNRSLLETIIRKCSSLSVLCAYITVWSL